MTAEMPNIELTVDTSRLERAAKKLARAYAMFDWDKHLASWLTASIDKGGAFASVVREIIQVEIENAERAPRKHKKRTK